MSEVDYKQMDDRTLVGLLLKDDHGAWGYFEWKVEKCIERTRQFKEKLQRKCHSPVDVVGCLTERLRENDFARLRSFRFEQSFHGWLWTYVRSAVGIVTGLDGSKNRMARANREEPMDPQDETATLAHIAAASNVSAHAELFLDARLLIAKLWTTNPQGAYAVLLNKICGVDDEVIGTLLGQKANTVTQNRRRALEKLRQWRDE